MTKNGMHFKKNGGLSKREKDWISIRGILNEIEKHGQEPNDKLLSIAERLNSNETWKKLPLKTKKELISKLVNVEFHRKHSLAQSFK
jgi:hypothetical protein